MRYFASALFVFLVAYVASVACAQYGLYGAPNVLPVQQQNVAAYPATAPAGYAVPANYPAQPANYPAQVVVQNTYQPYQPAAQYRYPAPNYQNAAWVAPVEQPMIPQPAPTPVPAPAPMLVPAPAPAPSNMPAYQYQQPSQPQPTYVPQQGCGLMNQVLADQNGCNSGCNNNGNCGQDALCGSCNECLWYSSFEMLVLGRSPGRRVWTSSEKYPNEWLQLGHTDIPMAWSLGGQVQLGRRFCCGCTPLAVEATFWTTNAMTGSQTTTNPWGMDVPMGTPLQTGWINFNIAGHIIPANDIFDNAQTSTVTRRDEFYDFEINLIREELPWACDSQWEIGWSAGVRYFRFQESLGVGVTSPNIDNLGPGDAYFNDTVTNNLIGPQIGFDLAYNIGNNVRLFVNPTVGVFGNWVSNDFRAQGRLGSGLYVDGVNTVGHGYSNFPAHGSNAGVAFLTQVDLGADWRFSRNWSVRAGYRIVAITGMGLADDEFPQYLADAPEMGNPQHNSSLVLHGAFFGVTYCY
jgi:hypothetical protein